MMWDDVEISLHLNISVQAPKLLHAKYIKIITNKNYTKLIKIQNNGLIKPIYENALRIDKQ